MSPDQQRKLDDRAKEESRRGQFIKEQLYPLLTKSSTSIEDAKVFLETNVLVIGQAFMNFRTQKKVGEMDLLENLKHNPEAKRYEEVLTLLGGETVDAASDMLNAMKQIIDNNLRDETKSRKLDDLKLKFFNEIT